MDKARRSAFLGIILILAGLSILADNLWNLDDLMGSAFLGLVGIGLIGRWTNAGGRGFLIGGACVLALAIFVLFDEFMPRSLALLDGPLFFLSQAAAFYGVYRLDNGKPRWAMNTAVGLAAFSVFVFVTSEGHLPDGIAVGALLIAIGLFVIFKRR